MMALHNGSNAKRRCEGVRRAPSYREAKSVRPYRLSATGSGGSPPRGYANPGGLAAAPSRTRALRPRASEVARTRVGRERYRIIVPSSGYPAASQSSMPPA